MKKLSAYEFTRFEADFVTKEKVSNLDMNTIEFLIHYNNPTRDFTEEDDYKDALDMFYELTMSCDTEEAINWATYWMVNALAYGNQTKNSDWMHKFLAASDLFKELITQ